MPLYPVLAFAGHQARTPGPGGAQGAGVQRQEIRSKEPSAAVLGLFFLESRNRWALPLVHKSIAAGPQFRQTAALSCVGAVKGVEGQGKAGRRPRTKSEQNRADPLPALLDSLSPSTVSCEEAAQVSGLDCIESTARGAVVKGTPLLELPVPGSIPCFLQGGFSSASPQQSPQRRRREGGVVRGCSAGRFSEKLRDVKRRPRTSLHAMHLYCSSHVTTNQSEKESAGVLLAPVPLADDPSAEASFVRP